MTGETNVKGIILAGGKGTRLYPATLAISKHLIPIYDKPLVYYPLSTLMLAGIRDILVISDPSALSSYQKLLGDGSKLGLNLSYQEQAEPRGVADAYIQGADFVEGSRSALVLGDNIFYGNRFTEFLGNAASQKTGATIFANHVTDPERYGVVELDKNWNPTALIEKPAKPKSNWAVTGLYFYDEHVVDIAANLTPSARGELEITDVNREYLRRGTLDAQILGRGFAWMDAGTIDSLHDAANFVRALEKRQGVKICCPEEIAYRMNFINDEQLIKLAEDCGSSDYGKYLIDLLEEYF